MTQLVIINGGMGSGKSTLTELLSENYPDKNYYLKADDLIWGLSHESDKQKSQELAFKLSHSIIDTLLKSDITVFVEKVMNKAQVEKFLELAKTYSVKVTQIILQLPIDLAIKRVLERREKIGKVADQEYIDRVIKSNSVTDEIVDAFDNQLIFSTEIESSQDICNQIIKQIKINY